VPGKHPLALAADDVPHPDRAVVAARDEGAAAGGERPNGVGVALEVKKVIRVVVHVVLGGVDLGVVRAVAAVLGVARLWERPHAQGMVAAAGDDERPLRPILSRAIFHVHPLGLDNG
jgi:hypothetical protein